MRSQLVSMSKSGEQNDLDEASKIPDVRSSPTIQGITNIVSDKSIRAVTDVDRGIFTGLFICILVLSLLLNLAAIWTVSRRNYRFFQKTCIIALAASDLITVIAFSINNLDTLSHPYINWTLGSFLCHFIPMCQSFGVFSSSLALLIIAMDRYRSIVKALNKRWDPRKTYCIAGVVVGWFICAGMSIPMFIYYKDVKVLVIFLDENGNLPKNFTQETMYMCAAIDKAPLSNSYIIMIIVVFIPLLFIFFWFYYNIAQLIWKHRKPVGDKVEQKTDVSVTESSIMKTPESAKNHLMKTILKNNKNEQMKKKIRTFKIIIVLILSFIACRLPFWIFTLIKLTYVIKGMTVWRLNFLIIALNVFSTILNPLLYTYLNVTVKVINKILKELKSCFCCFFSDEEFVEFERGNLVYVNGFNDRKHHIPKENSTKHLRVSRLH